MKNNQNVRPSDLLAHNPASTVSITRLVLKYNYQYIIMNSMAHLAFHIQVPESEVSVRSSDLSKGAALQGRGARGPGNLY